MRQVFISSPAGGYREGSGAQVPLYLPLGLNSPPGSRGNCLQHGGLCVPAEDSRALLVLTLYPCWQSECVVPLCPAGAPLRFPTSLSTDPSSALTHPRLTWQETRSSPCHPSAWDRPGQSSKAVAALATLDHRGFTSRSGCLWCTQGLLHTASPDLSLRPVTRPVCSAPSLRGLLAPQPLPAARPTAPATSTSRARLPRAPPMPATGLALPRRCLLRGAPGLGLQLPPLAKRFLDQTSHSEPLPGTVEVVEAKTRFWADRALGSLVRG